MKSLFPSSPGRFVLSFLLLVGTARAATPNDTAVLPSVDALEIPANRGSAALWQSLKKLQTRASLVMITAHPDDEDGGVLAYESRGLGARTSLLTLNRGEGGANVMSPDFWDALGLLRTHELLQAGRYYGADQYFARFCDYGFSKTLDETLSKWLPERVLADVVRLVRMTRPLVITSVFVGGPSDGHGNHQAAGRMAKEVFEAAGDRTRFPEQLREGLRPWQPLKYYARVPVAATGKSTLNTTVSVPEGTYDAALGLTYQQLGREGLGYQKSQNGGPFIPRAGNDNAPYHRFASQLPAAETENSFFDGIDTSLAGIASLVPDAKRALVLPGLQEISRSVFQATAAFSFEHPENCGPPLADGLQTVTALIKKVEQSSLVDANEKFALLYELRIKQTQFNNALLEALGVSIRATVLPEKEVSPAEQDFFGDPDTFRVAIPGQRFGVRVSVSQQSKKELQLARVYLEPHNPQDFVSKGIDLPSSPSRLTSNQVLDSKFDVGVSSTAAPTRPYFSRPSIEQPYYDLLNPADFGRPFVPYPLSAWAAIRYRGQEITLGQVVQTVHRDTGLGVVYEPLVVGPPISVQVEPRAGIVPLDAKSFPLHVTVLSNVKNKAVASVKLELPQGWHSEPKMFDFQSTQDGESKSLNFKVYPSSLTSRSYELAAVAEYAGKTYREGYTIAGYPGIGPSFLYSASNYKTVGTDVKVAPDLRVAYVTGSGDSVPETLLELGIPVTFLNANDIASADLSRFDAVLLGVRAYAARPELAINNGRLLEYVRNGGVLIVQYNTPEFDHNYGPYPYVMGKDPEEVTDEASKVNILDPSNPIFNWPNKITTDDFTGWIEERGSKFMNSWDNRYAALLETADPGQSAQRGGMLYAKYGKGIYIYNAYAFYRQLPEGVPGAFRLMANILSLSKNPRR
jgi:LmbE family N-acetylglucosaminyl deacetylase